MRVYGVMLAGPGAAACDPAAIAPHGGKHGAVAAVAYWRILGPLKWGPLPTAPAPYHVANTIDGRFDRDVEADRDGNAEDDAHEIPCQTVPSRKR